MEGTLQEALQNGKAHPKMKKVWTIRWMFSFVMFFIFMMFFIGFRFLDLIFGLDLISIFFIYIIIPIILGLIFTYIWAHLYWNNYKFNIGTEKVTITRGVIGKRIANIPYERIQNVNIWRGVLERIFNLHVIQIETAGGFAGRTYGRTSFAEGTIQGLLNPQPIVNYIMAKAKGRDGLGDIVSKKELGRDEKLKLLEERLIKGEISEKTYEELKRKYETSD